MKQDSDRPGEIADGEPPRIAGLRASLGPVADSLKEQTSEHFAEVRRALFDLRSAPALARPERGAHLQRFIYGFGLPFRILRALFRDPAAKRQYLRVILTQLTIVLGLGALFALLGHSRDAFSGNIRHDFAHLVAVVSAFYATLGAVEWIVVALSRQYHDQLGRQASLLSGAPPEDPERRPRIHLDMRWMARKLKRKVRGLLVIGAGFPAVFVASLVPFAGRFLYPVLALSWTTYWVGVFAASKSAYAWRSDGDPQAPDPWFLRAADRATKDTIIGRLGLPRLYVFVWRKLSTGVFPPAREFEDHPYELLGVAAFRALLALPGTYLFFRPLLPVAAAHVLCTAFPTATASISRDEIEGAEATDGLDLTRGYPARLPPPGRLPELEERIEVQPESLTRAPDPRIARWCSFTAEATGASRAEAPPPRSPLPRSRSSRHSPWRRGT